MIASSNLIINMALIVDDKIRDASQHFIQWVIKTTKSEVETLSWSFSTTRIR